MCSDNVILFFVILNFFHLIIKVNMRDFSFDVTDVGLIRVGIRLIISKDSGNLSQLIIFFQTRADFNKTQITCYDDDMGS